MFEISPEQARVLEALLSPYGLILLAPVLPPVPSCAELELCSSDFSNCLRRMLCILHHPQPPTKGERLGSLRECSAFSTVMCHIGRKRFDKHC